MADQKVVMVVDDEPDIVKMVRISFEMAGFTVLEAVTGEECLSKLSLGKKPDLILLDIMLPGMNGYAVCRKIREDSALKGIKVAMLTAKGQRGDADQGLKSGADDYIIKPFDPFELVTIAKEIIAR